MSLLRPNTYVFAGLDEPRSALDRTKPPIYRACLFTSIDRAAREARWRRAAGQPTEGAHRTTANEPYPCD